jgi:hypothetical protein
MDGAALAVSVLAVLIAAASAWFTLGQKRAAEDAVAEARRSADAAQEAVSYDRDEVERNRIRFELSHVDKSRYAIRNEGTDTAYCVRFDLGGAGVQGGGETEFETFESGQAESFILAQSLQRRVTHVVVKWHQRPDCSDEPRQAKLLVP